MRNISSKPRYQKYKALGVGLKGIERSYLLNKRKKKKHKNNKKTKRMLLFSVLCESSKKKPEIQKEQIIYIDYSKSGAIHHFQYTPRPLTDDDDEKKFFDDDDDDDDDDDNYIDITAEPSLLESANLEKLSIPGKSLINNICIKQIEKEEFSPLSLVFSTTSGINLIESECVTPTSIHWGDSSSSDIGENYEENWNQIDFDNLRFDQRKQKKKEEEIKRKEFNINKSYLSIRSSLSGSNKSDSIISNISNTSNMSSDLISIQQRKQRKLTLSSTNSNISTISDICLEFPFCTKIEETMFDLSQKNHNSKIANVDMTKCREIGQDLFHKFHIMAWKKTKQQKNENVINKKNGKKKWKQKQKQKKKKNK